MISLFESTLKAGRQAALLSMLALPAVPAMAQSTAATTGDGATQAAPSAAQASSSGKLEEVVVTGTLLKRASVAPTPVTVMSVEELQATSPNSVGDALAQLPAFAGSTVTSNLGSVSSAFGGAQALLNLRGLGSNRTLVLLDGERLPVSNVNGSVDINVIPQALLSRVDVVTGGASSTYGSDAVAGVVNFVLNRNFKGVQLNFNGGETSHHDAANEHVTVVAGNSFDDGRLRLEGSLEYFNQAQIGLGRNGRGWYDNTPGFVTLPAGSATTYGIIPQVGFSTMAYGGLITKLTNSAGKTGTVPGLSGMQFGAGGVLQPFDFGTHTGASFQSGGSGPFASNGLSPAQDRQGVFLHGEYDINSDVTAFGEAMYNRSHTDGNGAYAFEQTSKAFTIYNDNAYLPAPVASLMAANHLASFTLGRLSADLPPIENKDTTTLERVNVGLRVTLTQRWSFDTSLAHSISEQDYKQFDTINRNLYAAADAVVNPAGQIVCRSTLAGLDPGCVPIDILGTNTISSAGAAYVAGWDDGDTIDRQTAFNANLRGDLGDTLTLGAGPISLAVGAAWRQDKAERTVSPLSDIFTSCTGLRASGCTAYNNVYGGYQSYNPGPLTGTIRVTEGDLEFGIPVLKDLPLIKSFDIDVAGRATDYNTSGMTYTWKVGPTWQVTKDLRVRATRSQDIRAPDLNELFSTVSSSNTVTSTIFPASSAAGPLPTTSTTLAEGNLALKPEVAQTFTAGVVYQPSWLEGFNGSVDFYRIDISGAIFTPASQTIVDGCYAGIQSDCQLISVGGNPVTTTAGLDGAAGITVKAAPVNAASLKTSGFDAELAYKARLWGGAISGRALANYVDTYSNTAAASPNGPVFIGAYALGALAIPRWTINLSEQYAHPLGATAEGAISVQERLIAGGKYNPNYTAAQFPAAGQDVPEVTYTDVTASFRFQAAGADAELYLTVLNLFNVSPPSIPIASTFQQPTNFDIYDVLGRRFTLGLKAKW